MITLGNGVKVFYFLLSAVLFCLISFLWENCKLRVVNCYRFGLYYALRDFVLSCYRLKTFKISVPVYCMISLIKNCITKSRLHLFNSVGCKCKNQEMQKESQKWKNVVQRWKKQIPCSTFIVQNLRKLINLRKL